ncbi:MAG: hypothetical protein GEU26_14845 [Nitrososphaeraceae archaeon]|nr:hypothetical protein [Nitrososphaeraceae archaeon]
MSSQEELEDAYKGTQWENNIGPNDFEEVTNNNDDNNDDEDIDEEEEDNWNESYRDACERAGESENALNAATYDL